MNPADYSALEEALEPCSRENSWNRGASHPRVAERWPQRAFRLRTFGLAPRAGFEVPKVVRWGTSRFCSDSMGSRDRRECPAVACSIA